MSTPIPANTIEQIVDATRHPLEHIGRAVSTEETIYILHSGECYKTFNDLRDCPFSKALDRGIDREQWEPYEDRPVKLRVSPRTMRLWPAGDLYDYGFIADGGTPIWATFGGLVTFQSYEMAKHTGVKSYWETLQIVRRVRGETDYEEVSESSSMGSSKNV